MGITEGKQDDGGKFAEGPNCCQMAGTSEVNCDCYKF